MALDPPSEVVKFLNFIGIDWPDVNEDAVREFASHVREFSSKISSAHDDATSTVKQVGDVYSGAAYEAMVAKWASTSTAHISELTEACSVVATALDVAADAIVAMKGVAIAELIALAISFAADQVAAALTFGIAEAAEALVIAAGKKAIDFLEQQLEQQIVGEVVEAAIKPLLATVERAVEGLVYNAASAALGGGASSSSFSIDTEAVTSLGGTMATHADTVRSATDDFTSKVASVNFAS
jgi:uncharacterized protein YukE